MVENIMPPIKVVIADDHLFFRTGFLNIIQSQHIDNEIIFVGEAGNGLELIDCVTLLRPDIVITDIKMPVMDGIEATRIIKQKFPDTGIIALSAFEDTDSVIRMLQAGANAYIIKTATYQEVIDAINKVQEGKPYYCSAILDKVYGKFTTAKMLRTGSKPINFSFQEINIVKLICKQLTTKEIAQTLNLHTRTVEDHRRTIQEKIGARNFAGIVIYALINEIVKLADL